MDLGLILFVVILDLTFFGPRLSDPMDQIYTSPLRFLWSLGADLTVIGYSGLVIQQPLSFFLLIFDFHIVRFFS